MLFNQHHGGALAPFFRKGLIDPSGGIGANNVIVDSRLQSDTDAAAIISACSLSAGAQQNAAYFLVGALKYYSLWTKMTALYGFAGGTAGAHSINWKTPGTYNITWNGTVTHNSNGITGNGSTGYGDTGLIPNSVLSQNSKHLSLYSRTDGQSTAVDFGAYSSASSLDQIGAKYTNGNSLCALSGITANSAIPDALGAYVTTRTSSTLVSTFKQGRKIASSTSASTGNPTHSIYILVRNVTGSPESAKSSRNLSFASIGSGLTDQDAINLSAIVQSYQTILGRAV